MHIITELRINNFRSIRESKFHLTSYAPFVGYNNGGKSNVLKALAWLFKKSNLAASDFYNPEIPVSVEGLISGITPEILENLEEKHRNKISPYVVNGLIQIRRTQFVPAASVKEFSFDIRKGDGSGDWAPNPTGIDNAITEMFPEPIVIGAMQDAAEDVAKFGKTTTIGQILSQIMEPVRNEQNEVIEQALAEVRDKLSANGADKNPQLRAIDDLMDVEVKKFFPGVSVKTHIPVPQFDDFLKGGTVKIFEDGLHHDDQGRAVSTMGHGSQRAIQMALINCLSVVKKEAAVNTPRTTLLLIDEPELYLHPQAIERVRVALKALATSGYQVIFTTHSAHMIASEDAENVVFIRRSPELGTHCRPTIKTAVREAIENADHQAEMLFSLTQSSRILFADSILLSEGKTERRLLPGIFQKVTGKTFEENKIALIEVSGSSNIPSAMKILECMGLPVKAIVDLDFAFKEAPKTQLIDGNCDEISSCRTILITLEAAGEVTLSDDGFPKKHNGKSASDGFERLAGHPEASPHINGIHDNLKAQGVWVWTKGAIEPHLGLGAKSASEWSNFQITSNNNETIDFIPDPQIVRDLCDWLISE